MITCAKAISRREMDLWAAGGGPELDSFLKKFNKVWVVSISDADTTPLFYDDDMTICLQFDDMEPDLFDLLAEEFGDEVMKAYFPMTTLCKKEQAKKIVDFIKKAHADNNENDILLVNCHAGVCRSGAVAEFTAKFLKLNLNEFFHINPQIAPNRFVLGLLEEVAGKDNGKA